MPLVFKCECGNYIPAIGSPCKYCGKETELKKVQGPFRRIRWCVFKRIKKNQDARWKK